MLSFDHQNHSKWHKWCHVHYTHPQHALTHTHGADYVLRSARSGSGFWAGSICLVHNGTGCPHTHGRWSIMPRGGTVGSSFRLPDHVATWAVGEKARRRERAKERELCMCIHGRLGMRQRDRESSSKSKLICLKNQRDPSTRAAVAAAACEASRSSRCLCTLHSAGHART